MIRKFLKSITKNSVMVVGDIMLDRYFFGEISKKSDEAPIDIVKINKTSEKLGGAANVALSLQKLNTNVLLFGFVGNDFYGEKIISIMKKNKMNTAGIIKQHKTTIKTRIIISSQTQFARFDSEKIQYQTNKNKEKLKKIIKLNIPKSNLIILQDYNKGVLDKKLIHEIIKEGTKNNIPIMVDPKEKNFLKYQNIMLIKPNLKEAEKLLKRKINIIDSELKQALFDISKKIKSKWIILTLGKNGLCIFRKGIYHREKGGEEINADVTGAGDSVMSLASLAILHKLHIKQITKLSMIAGELSCKKVGTNPIIYAELLKKWKETKNN